MLYGLWNRSVFRWPRIYFKVLFLSVASHARSAKMRPIAAEVAWSVCLSVCLLDNREPYKTAEPVEMPFWDMDSGGPREPHVLSEGLDPPTERGIFGRRAYPRPSQRVENIWREPKLFHKRQQRRGRSLSVLQRLFAMWTCDCEYWY